MKVRQARYVKSGTAPSHYPPADLPEVAFAGRSNVGKSSLMNALLQRKNLVRVSSTPGRTQLLSWFEVNQSMRVCDLPGYGFAKVPAAMRAGWQTMVGTYLERRDCLLALAILIDVRRGFKDDDLGLVEACSAYGLQPILVGTKIDKLKPNALYNQKRAIAKAVGADPERDIVWTSASTGVGRDALWSRIAALLPDESSA